jgi:hypothetical protein
LESKDKGITLDWFLDILSGSPDERRHAGIPGTMPSGLAVDDIRMPIAVGLVRFLFGQEGMKGANPEDHTPFAPGTCEISRVRIGRFCSVIS